jgi:hypothetical protein
MDLRKISAVNQRLVWIEYKGLAFAAAPHSTSNLSM